MEPGGRCADANKSRVGERRADHDGQSSGAMTTGLAASSVTAATNAPALRSSATVLWPVTWKFGDNQGRMCGMSVPTSTANGLRGTFVAVNIDPETG